MKLHSIEVEADMYRQNFRTRTRICAQACILVNLTLELTEQNRISLRYNIIKENMLHAINTLKQ